MKSSILSHALVSPLGLSSDENFNAIVKGESGIVVVDDSHLSENKFYASRISDLRIKTGFTRFESLCILSIEQALKELPVAIGLQKTAFILSTTKGNIEWIENGSNDKNLLLHHTAKEIASHFKIENSYVVSNACTSGVVAMLFGKQLLDSGQFENIIITGCDVLSKFVVSGFQSLHALSDEPCMPFDAVRKGLNLGEASSTIVLSSVHETEFIISGGGSTNDANHISGPSRTGEELGKAIQYALEDSGLTTSELDFISAHGTATPYNDEMESKAFHVAGVDQVPVHSLKGYFGHTLGAAGLVETVMSLQSLEKNRLIPTKGFSTLGVSKQLRIITQAESKPLDAFLKTASGFGGCNAALIVQRIKR